MKIDLAVKDLPALKEACRALGATFIEGQTNHRAYSRAGGKCDHAISHPACKYEVGVIRQQDGSYTFSADEWSSGGIRGVFGEGLGKLKQQYAATRSTRVMRRNGWRVKQTQDEAGRLHLACLR